MTTQLSIEQLYRTCDPAILGCSSSKEAEPLDTIIGQERAVHALRFGLDINNKGFNVFASGFHGTGRTTAIERFIKEIAAQRPVPQDWCYVNNFHDPLRPNAIAMPAGMAMAFKSDMERTVKAAIADLLAAFQSDEYIAHTEEISGAIEYQKQELLNQLKTQAQEAGFALQLSPMGLLSIPTKEGQPLSDQEYTSLSAEQKADIEAQQKVLDNMIKETTEAANKLDKNLRDKIEEADAQVALHAIQHHFETLKGKYADLDEVPHHIEHVCEDILNNISQFITEDEKPSAISGPPYTPSIQKYAVNVLVDNSNLEGAPVVLEMNPTLSNLIGLVEYEAVMGTLVTNFSLIRPGCLQRANGGFLVLPGEDVLRHPLAWESLKRALANDEILIENGGERGGFSTKTLRPEPIPLDIKVILIGRPDLYKMLFSLDDKFIELFKVKADFDTRMPRSEAHIKEYASFVCTLCENEGLIHLDQGALARVIEHASRLADDQEKMSTRFGEIADVIREASYYAAQEETEFAGADHVERAINERFYRSSLIYDRIQEMIGRGQIKISLSGEEIGQVNGLSVLDLGDIDFGQPNRITASIGLGRDGVIDIEREADMAGPIHTKGVLILCGYLIEKYAQDKPLTLSARLVFEQNYAGVEGDSASSTELYALLSALSRRPIKQGIAVTGSVNQKGEVQVIGGVNEKIEGFFEVCRASGLTGEQGVMIPAGNITDLMLKRPVLEAVEQGKFHIWAIESVDEGIEILTGVKAGGRGEDGSFEADSINALVDERLTKLAI
ncbi:Lon protease family protein, partial [Chloroflexota bacterium]